MKSMFPFFIKNNETIYFDSAATTQKPEIFFNTLLGNYTNFSMPAGKSLYSFAEETFDASLRDQSFLQKFLNAPENNTILLFPSATLIGAFLYSQIIKNNKHLTISLPLDGHNAIIGHLLNTHLNITIQWYETLTCTENDFNNSDIIYITAISHASGAQFDFERFKKSKKENQCWIVDACQHLPILPFDIQQTATDIVFFSTHKTYGTYGMAPLLINKEFKHFFNVNARCTGDNPIQKTFCGSTNIPGLFTSCTLLQWIEKNIYQKNLYQNFQLYNKKIQTILKEHGFQIISAPNAINIITAIPPKDLYNAHDYALQLDAHNICVRSGNLCADTWFEHNTYDNAIRISLGIYNNDDDIEKLDIAIKSIKNI